MERQYLFPVTSIYAHVVSLTKEFWIRRAELLLAKGNRYIDLGQKNCRCDTPAYVILQEIQKLFCISQLILRFAVGYSFLRFLVWN